MTPVPPPLALPAGSTFAPLLPEFPDQPFWQVTPATAAADYADGLEELIADYNRQPEERLAEWAKDHPLTADQRFILEYNTTADRANVLRPLPLAPGDRVLEVGCGCGPVSQYLWSRAHTVSLDASTARARAAARRLARRPNPHQSILVCADFHRLEGDASFDWVIFNGVLEYAAIYSGASEASPYIAMLRKAATFLRPGGRCVIAIENRLGLKYFAGAPEDHYGRPAVGLEGYRTPGQARPNIRTFSKPELAALCRDAGFTHSEFLFPFPDYKFAKVVVPDRADCWQFAAERMIETSPAWRGGREHHFDEAAVYRSLAAEGLAGDFSHSFLVVSSQGGRAAADPSLIHYYPLHRAPANAIGVVLDVARGEARRRKLAGGPSTASVLPRALANPRAGFVMPAAGSDPETLVQPLSPVPTLWEELRRRIGAATDAPDEYRRQLEQVLHTQQDLYHAGLPFSDTGTWPGFIAKLRAEFARASLEDTAAGLLGFLEGQRKFAEDSLARMTAGAWSAWTPDWIMENLFPTKDGGVRLFDVEYSDPTASLPTPALVYRQLRVLQTRTAHPALAEHWPWAPRQLTLEGVAVILPSPAAARAATFLWGELSLAEADRVAWFWSKVAEILECAMIATAAAPFTLAYETAPWVERLSGELGRLHDSALAALPVGQSELARTATAAVADRSSDDDLARKEQLIRQQGQEIGQLSKAADERLELILKLDREVTRLRGELQAARPGADAPMPEALPVETEIIHLQARLAEARRQLQVSQASLVRRERELQLLKPHQRARLEKTFLERQRQRLGRYLADRTTCPLAQLQQYAPRPMRRESFPRLATPDKWPRVCLITPSYQQAGFLERTMRSVLDQNYPNLAYGVQDGGSTDGSANLITKYLPRLAHAESAPDKGQADAIRRGFEKLYPAGHDIMAWLNSDDTLMPGALRYVGAYFAAHPEVDVVYGHRVIINETDQEVGRWFMPRFHSDTLQWFDLVPQETLFWRARCYQEVGGLDTSFQFALDWDLLLRFEQACFTIRRLPYFLGCFRVHPEQKTSAKIQSVGEQEMARLRRRTHDREVPAREVLLQLSTEIERSALTERLHRLGFRH